MKNPEDKIETRADAARAAKGMKNEGGSSGRWKTNKVHLIYPCSRVMGRDAIFHGEISSQRTQRIRCASRISETGIKYVEAKISRPSGESRLRNGDLSNVVRCTNSLIFT